MKVSAKLCGAALVCALVPTLVASPATASPNDDFEDIATIAEGLRAGDAPRTTAQVGAGEKVTYLLQDGSKLTFYYNQDGSLAQASPVPPNMTVLVSGGLDPVPYVDLDPGEQGAAASGVAGTLGAAICAALGPETAGVGCAVAGGVAATIIAVAASHGVCPDSRVLRVHLNGGAQCL